MMEEVVYICFSKYGKYKQQCKFNLEQVASAATVQDKYVQLLLTEYATRENVQFTSKNNAQTSWNHTYAEDI